MSNELVASLVELERELRGSADGCDSATFDTRVSLGELRVWQGRREAYVDAADLVRDVRESLPVSTLLGSNGAVLATVPVVS